MEIYVPKFAGGNCQNSRAEKLEVKLEKTENCDSSTCGHRTLSIRLMIITKGCKGRTGRHRKRSKHLFRDNQTELKSFSIAAVRFYVLAVNAGIAVGTRANETSDMAVAPGH
ncbi:hypothetical protein HUJ04_006363 [Dendroctonus ponderosae]|nr:hypothetical protein HUJ04_006363 [Dendroctonus ponderosae]